jgi:hypothetical protein
LDVLNSSIVYKIDTFDLGHSIGTLLKMATITKKSTYLTTLKNGKRLMLKKRQYEFCDELWEHIKSYGNYHKRPIAYELVTFNRHRLAELYAHYCDPYWLKYKMYENVVGIDVPMSRRLVITDEIFNRMIGEICRCYYRTTSHKKVPVIETKLMEWVDTDIGRQLRHRQTIQYVETIQEVEYTHSRQYFSSYWDRNNGEELLLDMLPSYRREMDLKCWQSYKIGEVIAWYGNLRDHREGMYYGKICAVRTEGLTVQPMMISIHNVDEGVTPSREKPYGTVRIEVTDEKAYKYVNGVKKMMPKKLYKKHPTYRPSDIDNITECRFDVLNHRNDIYVFSRNHVLDAIEAQEM